MATTQSIQIRSEKGAIVPKVKLLKKCIIIAERMLRFVLRYTQVIIIDMPMQKIMKVQKPANLKPI